MAAVKTVPTDVSVEDFLASVDPGRHGDSRRLMAIMAKATGEDARMWGPSIIGFGNYHYRYPTGHEGDAALVGFSPRKAEFSIYLMGLYFPENADAARLLLEHLGKHRMGKACLYVRKLADIDEDVLTQLIALSTETLRQVYGA